MNELKINIHRSNISFTFGHERLTLLPFVVLELSRGKEIVKSVGIDVSSDLALKKILLFELTDRDSCKNKKHLLDVFFSYGMRQIQKKRSFILQFIRPVVNVSGMGVLREALMGYQYHLIEDSLLYAGARKVIFNDKEN